MEGAGKSWKELARAGSLKNLPKIGNAGASWKSLVKITNIGASWQLPVSPISFQREEFVNKFNQFQ